jgi:hypothetical protein
MAVRTVGITGNITLPTGFSGAIFRGTLDLDATLIDVTNATTSAGNAERLTGVKSCTGTAMAYPQNSGSGLAPGWATIPSGANIQTPAAMTVTAASGCTYVFTAVISKIAWGWDYSGKQTLTFSYASSGAIVESWS